MHAIHIVPQIVMDIRNYNIGLGIFIYENRLNPEHLHWFTKFELEQIKRRTSREDLNKEIDKLLE